MEEMTTRNDAAKIKADIISDIHPILESIKKALGEMSNRLERLERVPQRTQPEKRAQSGNRVRESAPAIVPPQGTARGSTRFLEPEIGERGRKGGERNRRAKDLLKLPLLFPPSEEPATKGRILQDGRTCDEGGNRGGTLSGTARGRDMG